MKEELGCFSGMVPEQKPADVQTLSTQVLSVVGMLALNALFLEVNWNIITSDEDYVPFPAAWFQIIRALRALLSLSVFVRGGLMTL